MGCGDQSVQPERCDGRHLLEPLQGHGRPGRVSTVLPDSDQRGLTTPPDPPTTPPTTPPVTPPTTPPVTPPTTPPVTPPSNPSPPSTPAAITPTVTFAPGSGVVVNGIVYANGKRPWFIGTATAGSTVQVILSGAMVVGKSKVIGTLVASAANTFSFQLPAGIKNGTYTLVIHVLGAAGSPVQVSTPLSFRVGPIPKVKAVRKPPVKVTRLHTVKAPAKTVVKVKPHTAAAHPLAIVSTASANVVDKAIHSLVLHPLLRKSKGH